MEIVAWHVYVAIGIMLILGEMFLPGFILAPIGIASLVTALCSLLIESIAIQLFLMGVFSIVVYFLLTPIVRRLMKHKPNNPAIGITGQTGSVEKSPEGPNNPGYVRVYGDKWDILWDESDAAYTKSLRELSQGAQIRIVAVEGNRVRIEKI